MKQIMFLLFCAMSIVLMANPISEIKKLETGAQQGDAIMQRRLGNCYYLGEGVAQSYPEAVKWFRKAAEQGDAAAQCLLGSCYYLGEGVAQNYAEAIKWFRKAAEQGHAAAQCFLGNCYYDGKVVTQNYAEAVKWLRKAAKQGFADAQFRLGYCYSFGEGVMQDDFEAIKWFREAAKQGHAEAKKFLMKVAYAVSDALVDKARAVYQKHSKALEQNDFYSFLHCYSSYVRKNHYDSILGTFKEGVQTIQNGAQLNIQDIQFEDRDNEIFYFRVTFCITARDHSSSNMELQVQTAFIFEGDNFVIVMERFLE